MFPPLRDAFGWLNLCCDHTNWKRHSSRLRTETVFEYCELAKTLTTLQLFLEILDKSWSYGSCFRPLKCLLRPPNSCIHRHSLIRGIPVLLRGNALVELIDSRQPRSPVFNALLGLPNVHLWVLRHVEVER
jgi:hypothetical protein